MARRKGSYQHRELPLWREMALLLESGQAKDIDEAIKAVEHKAGGSKKNKRRRLKTRFEADEIQLRAWAKAQLAPPRGNLKAAARSVQRGIDHMLWLQRSVAAREAKDRAARQEKDRAAQLMGSLARINGETESD